MKTFIKGKAFDVSTILLAQGSRDAQAAPTLAVGDVQISKDFGAFANISTLPVVTPAGGVQVKISLSDTEADANIIMIRFNDQAGDQWEEQTIICNADDIRNTRTQYPLPTNFDERGGVISSVISRSGYPDYAAFFTNSDSPSVEDFDTNVLIGAVLARVAEVRGGVILGGYFFDDTTDTTTNVFGIALDTRFGITEGGSTIINNNWTGSGSLAEAGLGSGWTFILANAEFGTPPVSDEDLELFYSPTLLRDPTPAASSSGDWPSGELEQIRGALGVDGTKTTATGGQLQTIDTNLDTVNTNVATLLSDVTQLLSDVADVQNAVDALALVAALEATSQSILSGVTAVVAKLPASGSISNYNPSTSLVDGMTYEYIHELIAAVANGRYAIDTPDPGKLTFYKRDNSTVLTVVDVSTTGRTRIS